MQEGHLIFVGAATSLVYSDNFFTVKPTHNSMTSTEDQIKLLASLSEQNDFTYKIRLVT